MAQKKATATAKEKGDALECEVASWLEAQGFVCEVNVRVKGQKRTTRYQVDVHAVWHSPVWRRIGRAFLVVWILAGIVVMLDYVDRISAVMHAILGIDPKTTAIVIFAIAIFGAIASAFGDDMSARHAWVECRNRQKKVSCEDMDTFHAKVRDVVAYSMRFGSPSREWVPAREMMFSSSGFTDDALDIAHDHKFECYEPLNGGFNRVD